jgi:hypothetical protein
MLSDIGAIFMHLIPLALGLLAILIGIAMVAFGIPNNEFGIGNTLIAAGTTAIIGGFILLGLWAAVQQLQRMLGSSDLRSPRALPRRAQAATDSERAAHPVEPENADLGARLAPEYAPERGATSAPEPERAAERGGWSGAEREPKGRERTSLEERTAPREEESSWELFAPSRPSEPARERSFEAIWPSERAPREGRGSPQDRGRAEESGPPPSPAPPGQSAAILKSGVINGMAYTLYTDGSIEAELPQGTLRFGSLDELRDYLAGHP